MVDARKFPETRWSMVLNAAEPSGDRARDNLCTAYWRPVYEFVRQLGCCQQEASDIAQGFFADLLERNDLSQLKPERGLFRSWLRKSVKNYLSKHRARARALKRGGTQRSEVFEEDGKASLAPSARHTLGTDATLDRAWDQWWAHSVVENALVRLQSHRACRGRLALYEELCCASTGTDFEKNDPKIARQLGIDVNSVRVYRLRVRRAFAECLNAEISRTIESDDDLALERQRLIRAFSAADAVLPVQSDLPKVRRPGAKPIGTSSHPVVYP